ncbi:MAG: hypothetical protein ACYC3X_27170 [Pirellulaceae bacterium]
MTILRAWFTRHGWFLAVLSLAALLRAWNLTEWSLWEDEEGTIHHAMNLNGGFPSLFPVFFVILRGVFELTGPTVAAGRIVSATIALGGLVVFYLLLAQFASRKVALLASLFVALNLGHLFWSQSIRYYNLVVLLQLVSVYAFLVGFEQTRPVSLIISNVAFFLALATHFSAVLLIPVYVVYLGLMIWRREQGAGYNLRGYLLFGVPMVTTLGMFAVQILYAQQMLGGWAISSAREPLHVLSTVVAYFGIPLVMLSPLALLFAPQGTQERRVCWFFVIAAVVLMVELPVITALNVINVAWYYALFAVLAFAAAAAWGLVGLYDRGYRRNAQGIGAVTMAYSAVFLVLYFTVMHGDRPRWGDAVAYLSERAGVEPTAAERMPTIYSSVPGIMAFYLGVDPKETWNQQWAAIVPADPPIELLQGGTGCWYVLEAKLVSPEQDAWLGRHATLCAAFEARTGPINRTVLVYSSPSTPRPVAHEPSK